MPLRIDTYCIAQLIKGEVEVEITEVKVDIRVEVVFFRGTVIIELFKHSWFKPDSSFCHFML